MDSSASVVIVITGNAYTGPSVSGCTGTETDKQIGMWERRLRGLRRMILGWDQLKPPDPPYLIAVDVTNINSVMLRVQESCDGPIATKFKGKSTRATMCHLIHFTTQNIVRILVKAEKVQIALTHAWKHSHAPASKINMSIFIRRT